MKRAIASKQKPAHRRVVSVCVLIPVGFEIEVSTDDENPSKDSDWTIDTVRRINADATPRQLSEQIDEDEYAAMCARAAAAKDI